MTKVSQKPKTLAGKSKYAELVDKIVARIESGELKAGQRISSENKLISKFGVSNTTAPRALLEIKNRSWVREVKGSGTFVSEMTPEKSDFSATPKSNRHIIERTNTNPSCQPKMPNKIRKLQKIFSENNIS